MKWIAPILVFIAGVAKAIMDTLQFHFSISRFVGINDQFWNAAISWKNKYDTWLPDTFTDGWHLAQFFFLESIFLAIILYKSLFKYKGNVNFFTRCADFLLLRGIFGVGFVLFYKYILIK